MKKRQKWTQREKKTKKSGNVSMNQKNRGKGKERD